MSESAAGSGDVVRAGVRYSLYVPVPSLPEDDCDDLALQLIVNGLVVPRVGERINLDGPRARSLDLVVSEVEHFFTVGSEQWPAYSRVVVTAELDDDSPVRYGIARELLNPETLARWVDDFPMLEMPEHLNPRV
ncbi:hypothetical protein [Nocardia sp. IFM 10818]